jgi:DNA end-binding protein Ku
MRSIWNGTISFGLVSIAVKLYAATEEKHIRFHQLHASDGARIRYKRTCVGCGDEVDYDHIAKGYDLGGGDMVMLTDDDFAGLPLASAHTIEVLEFVPAAQIDPILYANAYYLEPIDAAVKPYLLLREALVRTNRVAIVKVTLRQREQLATLRVRGKVLLLNTMLWPDEVREPEFGFVDAAVETRPAELAMASSLVESMATDFRPAQYSDNYRSALQKVIEAKVAGRDLVAADEETPLPTAAVDLITALRASVERARAARANSGRAADGDRAADGGRAADGAAPTRAEPAKARTEPPRGKAAKRKARKPKSASTA